MAKNRYLKVETDKQAVQRLKVTFWAMWDELESSKSFINGVCRDAINIIKHRTYRGRDMHGKLFEDYRDPGFWRAVRNELGLTTAVVTLRVTSSLYRAVWFRVSSPTEAELYVKRSDRRDKVAQGHQERGRVWFGLGRKDIKTLSTALRARLIQSVLKSIPDSRPVGATATLLRSDWEPQRFDEAAHPVRSPTQVQAAIESVRAMRSTVKALKG